jgi:epoxyqueuosine reductase QueG
VICPLVARDAGLGEIGGMGILMTPAHGPRVRIGVVTTDMVLQPDKYSRRHDVVDFCLMCKKCTVCCPGQSIPQGDPVTIDGIKRWQIDLESCYIFWYKAGTDCGRSMSVCSYSHSNRSLHRIVHMG